MRPHLCASVAVGSLLLAVAGIPGAKGQASPKSEQGRPAQQASGQVKSGAGPSADLVESETLRAELNRLAAETLKAAREAGEPAPKEVDPKDPAASIIRATRKHHPTFLRVPPEVERRWKEGTFADAAARDRIKAAVRTLADYNVALPRMHSRLIRQHQAKPLSGARLEVVAQLLEAEVAKLTKQLSDK